MPAGNFRIERSEASGIDLIWAETRRSFARHTHDSFGIGLIDRGGHRSASGRGQVEAPPGAVITVNPGEVHDGEGAGGNIRAWRMLYIPQDLVGAQPGEFSACEFHHPVIHDKALARTFDGLFLALSRPASADIGYEEQLIALLTAALGPAEKIERSVPMVLQHARARIDDDPAASFTLGDLAASAGLSRFQLIRYFERVTGLTPFAYRLQRRADLARGMIAKGASLADVAAASGFADQSHLTRTFVRRYGIAPGAYAKAVAPQGALQ